MATMPKKLPIVLAVVLTISGLVLWASGASDASGTQSTPTPEMRMKPPMPTNYPGGMRNPRYQADARRFERLMAEHIDRISDAGDAAEAGIFADLRASIGKILLALGVFYAVLYVVLQKRARPVEVGGS